MPPLPVPTFENLERSMVSQNSSFRKFTVLDTETTGLGRIDRLCSAAFISLNSTSFLHQDFQEISRAEILTDPGIPIPEKASAVNGFVRSISNVEGNTNLYARSFFRDHVPLTKAFLDRSIPVCHNAHFDIWYLYSEMHKVRQNVLPGGEVPSWGKIDPEFFLDMIPFVICTKMTFASILGLEVTPEYRKETSLDNLCDYLGVDRAIRRPGHRAIIDAELTAECFRRLAGSAELRKHIQVIGTQSIISAPENVEDAVSPEYDIRHRTVFSGSEWQVYNTQTDEILFRSGSEDEARRTLERHQHTPAVK